MTRIDAIAPRRQLTLSMLIFGMVVALGSASCVTIEAATSDGPEVTNVQVGDITASSAVVSWDLSPDGTGYVEYGADGDLSERTPGEASLLPFHIQNLTGLQPDTMYGFRIVSADADGSVSTSAGHSFRTLGTIEQEPTQTGVYGTGIGADAKNNKIVDDTRVSHRFRASASAPLVAIRFQQRGGDGYSLGDGGRLRVSLHADSGRPDNAPSGPALASTTVRPGNPAEEWTTFERYVFAEPASVVEGRLYHIVFENVDEDPSSNYISVNEIFTFERQRPRQPALEEEYAVLAWEGRAWELQPQDTADMDLEYADGRRDGMAYIENMCHLYGVITGTGDMVRERFTVTGEERDVSEVSIRVKRTFGSEPLKITLQHSDGSVIESVEIPASAVASSEPGCTRGGAVWVGASFEDPVVLEPGATYDLLLTTGATSQYTTDPIREGTDKGLLSYRFTDGEAEYTTNGGSEWIDLYEWSPVDLQFYFR